MPLADVVNVAITAATGGVTRQGFGTPLILSPNAPFANRVRSYKSIADVAVDYATTTPEYLAANAMFSQNPRPPVVKMGRQGLKPTMAWTISVSAIANLTKYSVTVAGQTVTYTSDGTATNDEIADGLAALITALSIAGLTVGSTGAGGSHAVTLTANSAGAWFQASVADTTLLKIVQTEADAGIATDLAAILLEDGDWFAFVSVFTSKAIIVAGAAWAEANKKLFAADTQDSDTEFVAPGGTDVIAALKTSAYKFSPGFYHRDNSQMFAAAELGRCLPLTPGSETWKFKTLAGVAALNFTATQQANIEGKNGNYYYTVAGVNITTQGMTPDGEFIDAIRFLESLKADMGESVFGALANQAAGKVAYTDAGFAIIENEVRGALKRGIASGGLVADPAPTVVVPKASAASSGDRSARKLNAVVFTAQLAGAVHSVVVNGSIST